MIDLVATYTRGLLRFGRGRLEEACEALSAAESVRQCLSKNILTIDPRVQLIEVQVRLGQTAAAAAALAELSSEERDRAEMRLAAAAVHLGEGDPEHALAVLRPAIERSAPTIHPRTASMDALLFAAAAHNDTGDIRAVEESLERALDVANADGLILPFAMAPVRPLLERHPRHKTAHATLLSEILDLIAGSGRRSGEAAPLQEELSEAELRVVRYLPSNLKAPEIAAELFVSPNTVRTHMRHIYSKLDAHSRREAVDRARELGLISPGLVCAEAATSPDVTRFWCSPASNHTNCVTTPHPRRQHTRSGQRPARKETTMPTPTGPELRPSALLSCGITSRMRSITGSPGRAVGFPRST